MKRPSRFWQICTLFSVLLAVGGGAMMVVGAHGDLEDPSPLLGLGLLALITGVVGIAFAAQIVTSRFHR